MRRPSVYEYLVSQTIGGCKALTITKEYIYNHFSQRLCPDVSPSQVEQPLEILTYNSKCLPFIYK